MICKCPRETGKMVRETMGVNAGEASPTLGTEGRDSFLNLSRSTSLDSPKHRLFPRSNFLLVGELRRGSREVAGEKSLEVSVVNTSYFYSVSLLSI